MTLRIERYGKSRYWALYDGPDLVVVTLYKRGAQEVRRRLAAQPLAGAAGGVSRQPGQPSLAAPPSAPPGQAGRRRGPLGSRSRGLLQGEVF